MSDLSPISVGLMPPDIRTAGPQARAVYTAALSFEQQLVTQLCSSLQATTDSSDSDDDGDDAGNGGDASTSLMTGMVPQAMAQSITDAGGLGLAAELTQPLLREAT